MIYVPAELVATADDTYTLPERIPGAPRTWIARHGRILTIAVDGAERHTTMAYSTEYKARAAFAEATGDRRGWAAPRVGDRIALRGNAHDGVRVATVTAMPSTLTVPLFTVTDRNGDTHRLGPDDYVIVERPGLTVDPRYTTLFPDGTIKTIHVPDGAWGVWITTDSGEWAIRAEPVCGNRADPFTIGASTDRHVALHVANLNFTR